MSSKETFGWETTANGLSVTPTASTLRVVTQ